MFKQNFSVIFFFQETSSRPTSKEGNRRDERFRLHATFTNCVGLPTLKRGQWPRPPFSHSKEHWKTSLHRLYLGFSGPEHPPPRQGGGQTERERKRGDFMVLSLQLLRRYKQHLANSAPNGSRSSELQGLIHCCPPSIYTGFTKALHWREPKHFHSPRWLALDCDCGSTAQARDGGTGWDPWDVRDTLAGKGSCRVGRSTEMAQLSGKGQVPAQAVLMLVQGRIAHF